MIHSLYKLLLKGKKVELITGIMQQRNSVSRSISIICTFSLFYKATHCQTPKNNREKFESHSPTISISITQLIETFQRGKKKRPQTKGVFIVNRIENDITRPRISAHIDRSPTRSVCRQNLAGLANFGQILAGQTERIGDREVSARGGQDEPRRPSETTIWCWFFRRLRRILFGGWFCVVWCSIRSDSCSSAFTCGELETVFVL